MKIYLVTALLLCLGIATAQAQDQGNSPQEQGQGQGRWQGRGARGGGFGMMGQGRGTMGTVTEVAGDHYTIKTELGETYTVHYSVNTRIMKQPPRPAGARGEERGMGGNPPQAIKASDIKVGDVIAASGEVDASAKSVGAVFVMLIDPERAKQMREMEANYGKTWLAGRVTAIQDVKVTLECGPKNETQTFVADENTTFRKRRDPITLADIHPGDMVRVEGAMKDGSFLASSVAVMGPPPNREPGGGQSPPVGAPVSTPQ